MNIIEELYTGKMFPINELHIESEEYTAALEKVIASEKELLENFPECRDMLNKYQDNSAALSQLTARHEFCMGFRIGAQLMKEMLEKQ